MLEDYTEDEFTGLDDGEYTDGLMKYQVERYPGGAMRKVTVTTWDGDDYVIWAH